MPDRRRREWLVVDSDLEVLLPADRCGQSCEEQLAAHHPSGEPICGVCDPQPNDTPVQSRGRSGRLTCTSVGEGQRLVVFERVDWTRTPGPRPWPRPSDEA